MSDEEWLERTVGIINESESAIISLGLKDGESSWLGREDLDRLIRMARKVERYEKAVLEIKYELRDSDSLLREHGLDKVLFILDSALEDKE